MPLPLPRGDESEQEFVSRFMGDEEAVSKFPDETQRAAVAYQTYRDEEEEMECGDCEMEETDFGGVSILEIGEAKGHDLYVDKMSLEKAMEIMKKAPNGVKVKMNHGSGLDAVVGFARNARIEGDKLVADLKLLKNSPHYGLIKEMADEAPDQFGISLAFVNESETIEGKDYIRPQSIASADLVSSPAATNGLFEEMIRFMEKIKELNCGTGAGGFQPGNTCAAGGGGGSSASVKSSKKNYPKTPQSRFNISKSGGKDGVKDLLKRGFHWVDPIGDWVSGNDPMWKAGGGTAEGYHNLFRGMMRGKKTFSEAEDSVDMAYNSQGKPIPVDLPNAVVEGDGLTKEGEAMENKEGYDYKKDMDEIKVRLSALEEAMKPKDEMVKEEEKKEEVKAESAPTIVVEKEEEEKEEEGVEMAEVVKKVLTEFGIKPIPASPVAEVASEKKEEPKNFEALVSAHPEYKTSKLKAMKAVMLSNPKEYAEALGRGIKNI